ncbi:hypothetical protein MKX07_005842 [Trichoderma sp. CBMAI-0711]|uniref:Uncharacterized protein n=1 Tax=Trichoderma parareesei TaxID=858221 RepID=A0A2H2Z8S2_TRIPA|nr:hypothetical protein MKX07_005842 [Trichoderma sp. CBMAI-0711]OTA03729.1 hypothetical protein A9Z42_0042180 [Trichoderma parareesei]
MSDIQSRRHRSSTEHTRGPKRSGHPSTPPTASSSRRGETRTGSASARAEETANLGNGHGNTGSGKLIAPLKAFVGAAAKIAEEEASQQRWMARLEAGRAALRAKYLGESRTQGLIGLNEEATQCSISELSQLMEDISLEDESLMDESADEKGKGKKKDEDWVIVQEDFDVLVFLDDG